MSRSVLPALSLGLWLASNALPPAHGSAVQQAGGSGAPADTAERGLVLATDGAFAGYTLFAPLKSTNTYLVDLQGEVAHVWRHAFAPGLAVYLLDDGTLIRCSREPEGAAFRGGGQGGRVQRVDWEGAVLWDWLWSDDERMQHHDVEPLANGNLLVLAWEKKTREQAIAAGRDPFEVEDEGLWSEVVLEVEPIEREDARIVWEWHAWDHLVQDVHEAKPDFAPVASRPARIDVNWDVHDEADATPDPAELARERELEESMRGLGYVGDDPEPAAAADVDGASGAVSVSYNFGATIFGGTAPLVCTALISITGWDLAPGLLLAVASILILFVVAYTPETAPVKLGAGRGTADPPPT